MMDADGLYMCRVHVSSTRRRSPAVTSGASHRHLSGVGNRGRAFWLPYGGWDNGLSDEMWVPIGEVIGEDTATLLLAQFRDAAVPAYAARLRPRFRPARGGGPPHVGIWVGAASYGTAETLLLEILPGLDGTSPGRVLP
jgi:hypothetical protein